jgi:hypothetical protein
MRVIGLGLAAIFAVVGGCQKEPPVSESARNPSPAPGKVLSPAQETPAAKLAAPSSEEPSVAVNVEDDEAADNVAADNGHGEPMDEVDDVAHKAGSPEPEAADPPTEAEE